MTPRPYLCKSFYPCIVTQDPMDTLSGQDKFLYNSDGFQVIVPNPASDVQPYLLYDRVRVTDLRPYVLPEPRFTRGGHLSSHQPEPVEEQPYTFYLAQLVHYGLEFEWSRDAAKLSLAKAIQDGSLRVPPSIMHLERRLKQLWEGKSGDTILVGNSAIEESSDEVEGYISSETEDIDWVSEDVGYESADKGDNEDITNKSGGHEIEEQEDNITQVEKDVDRIDGENGTEDDDGATPILPLHQELSEEEDLDAIATLEKFVPNRTATSTASLPSEPDGTALRISPRIQPQRNLRRIPKNPFLIPGESSRVLGAKRKYVPPKKPTSEISVVITTSDGRASRSLGHRSKAGTGDEVGIQIDTRSPSREFYEESGTSEVTMGGQASSVTGSRSGNHFRAPFQDTASKVPKTARELNGVLHGQYSRGLENNYGDNPVDDSEWAGWDRPVAKHQKLK